QEVWLRLVIVRGEGSHDRLCELVVVPDRGGQREDAGQYPGEDALRGPSAVLFQVKLALEGPVDGLDDLPQRPEELLSRPLRRTVSREQPHCTGVESTTHTSSLHSEVSIASIRITRMNRKNAFRSRLLYPDCPIRRGNIPARCAFTYRSHRRSEVNPSSADI